MNGGNQLNEENPYYLHQPYRLPGQQHDEESGLTITGTGTMTRYRGGILHKTPLGWRGDGTCIITH